MSVLAIDGGVPTRAAPMPKWPVFAVDEQEAVCQVLSGGLVNYRTGSHGREFEHAFAAVTGCRHAIALSSGTAALEVALHALGVQHGDEVVVPAATFIATAAAVVRCGARPVIADVDPRTRCLSRETVEPLLSARTRAIVVVHLGGHPAELVPLLDLASRHDLRVVEDCAQAHGARYFGEPVGSLGDIGAWSFCQDKIVTTGGEGGAVTTSDTELWRRCWEFKDHGHVVTADNQRGQSFAWVHDSFGTNARMTEIQAVIGRLQLKRLDDWVKQRQMNAGVLLDVLRDLPGIHIEAPPAHVEHAYYRFYVRVQPEMLCGRWDRDRVVAALNAEGIPSDQGGCSEIYREKAFASIPGVPVRLPVAADLGRTTFTLPVHPALGMSDVLDIARAVTKVMRVASA